MNNKKIFLIIILISIISILSINASFSTNNKVETFTNPSHEYLEYKELNISETTYIANNEGNTYYTIAIKNNKQKNYRIKSVIVKYSINSLSNDHVINTKTYDGNKKLNLTIKIPRNLSVVHKITINYYSNTKINNEILDSKKGYGKEIQIYKGKSATIKNLKKTDIFSNNVKYNIIQIKTKNANYKIKFIKTVFKDFKSYYQNFKGNRKTKILLKIPYKHQSKFLTGLRIYYY